MKNPFNLSTDFKPTKEDLLEYEKYFKKKKTEFTEDALIQILLNSTSKSNHYWAILSLRVLGTKKSIVPLKSVVLSKSNDVQGTAVLAIRQLANGTENEFLGQLLLDNNFRQNYYALWAIFIHPNHNAVKEVEQFIVKSVKDVKKLSDSIPLALWYFDKYSEINGDIEKRFAKVKDNIELLPPFIKTTLKNETKYFAE